MKELETKCDDCGRVNTNLILINQIEHELCDFCLELRALKENVDNKSSKE